MKNLTNREGTLISAIVALIVGLGIVIYVVYTINLQEGCRVWTIKERTTFFVPIKEGVRKEQFKYTIQCGGFERVIETGDKIFPVNAKITKEWILK